MSSPIQQGIPVGAFLPALFTEKNLGRVQTNILYTDNYNKIYKKFGIRRYQMMVVMPFALRTDPLVGVEVNEFEYIGENKDKQK